MRRWFWCIVCKGRNPHCFACCLRDGMFKYAIHESVTMLDKKKRQIHEVYGSNYLTIGQI